MVSMSDDERFDMWLKDAAAGYNAPRGEVPREAMWTAIEAGIKTPAPVSRRWALPRWIPAAAAAAVLMAVAYRAGVTRGERAGQAAAPVAATSDATGTYDEAARVHFERADALLTSARSTLGAVSELDPATEGWARDMLADTRLLLDSPAANRAERRALLEDLELTLAQLVQLSAAGTPDDRRHVERSLRGGELLTRIRNSAPAPVRGT